MQVTSEITPEICNKCCNCDGNIMGKCGLFEPDYNCDLNGKITGIYCYNYEPKVESRPLKNYFSLENSEHYINIKNKICEIDDIFNEIFGELEDLDCEIETSLTEIIEGLE